jgi:hypothetical protein
MGLTNRRMSGPQGLLGRGAAISNILHPPVAPPFSMITLDAAKRTRGWRHPKWDSRHVQLISRKAANRRWGAMLAAAEVRAPATRVGIIGTAVVVVIIFIVVTSTLAAGSTTAPASAILIVVLSSSIVILLAARCRLPHIIKVRIQRRTAFILWIMSTS